jgi:hypothetical protein
MAANVGWRSNAFKVVALLSSNDQYFNTSIASNILSTNIVPLFYMPTVGAAILSKVQSYISTLPSAYINFGSSNDNSKRFQGWSLDAYNAISFTTNVTYFGRTSTTSTGDSFIASIPNNTSRTMGRIINATVSISYPPGPVNASVTSTTAQVTAYGFGTQTYTISVVLPPTAYDSSVSGSQGTDLSFTVSAVSQSRQPLGILIASSPNGAVYNSSGTGSAYALNTRYSGTTHVFRPASGFWGSTYISLRVNDGCQNSSLVNVTITIARTFTAPRGNSFSASIPYNSRLSSEQLIDFTSQISDNEEAANTLMITLVSVPSSFLGTLVNVTTGTTLTNNSYLGTLRTVRFIPTLWRSGSYSFTYVVTDPTSRNSTTATVTITVPFANTVPTLSAPVTVVYSPRGTTNTITVSARDQDFGEQLNLIATNNSMLGVSTFQATAPTTGSSMTGLSSLPFTLLSSSAPDSNGSVNYTLRWVPSLLSTNFIDPTVVTVYVADSNGGSSASISFSLYVIAPPVSPACLIGYIVSLGGLSCTACPCGTSSAVRFKCLLFIHSWLIFSCIIGRHRNNLHKLHIGSVLQLDLFVCLPIMPLWNI